MNRITITSIARASTLLERGVKLQVQVGADTRNLEGIEDFIEMQNHGEATVTREAVTNKRDGHGYTKYWGFESEEERDLANAFAAFAEMNGMSNNDVMQMFPGLCRLAGAGRGTGWA